MKALFIGGTGTISAAIVRRLVNELGWEVWLLNRGNRMDAVPEGVHSIIADMKKSAEEARTRLDNLFAFAEKVWGEGQEMVIRVTELTIGLYSSRFISRYGCDAYHRNNDSLKLYERKLEILKKGEELWQQSTM